MSSARNSFQLSSGNNTVSLSCKDQNIVGLGLPRTPHSNIALLPADTWVSAGLWAINGTAEKRLKKKIVLTFQFGKPMPIFPIRRMCFNNFFTPNSHFKRDYILVRKWGKKNNCVTKFSPLYDSVQYVFPNGKARIYMKLFN